MRRTRASRLAVASGVLLVALVAPWLLRWGLTGPTAESGAAVALADQALSVPATGRFSFDSAGRIFDPAGKRFVPVGVNANGPDFVWSGPTIGRSAAMDRWGFNTLRLTSCLPQGCDGLPHQTVNNDLAGIVREYTAKNKVVIITQMQWGAAGGANTPERLAALSAWWKSTASAYKDNPYVWFNLLNEPTGGDAGDLPAWKSITTTLASAVRSTGASNPIVVDGNSYGQEVADWGCGTIPWQNSAFATYGQSLQASYGSVVFSLHAYGEWGGNEAYGCGPTQWDTRMNTFIDRMQALHLPLVIGETGAVVDKADEDWGRGGAWNGTHVTFRVAPARGIGVLFWHGDAGTDQDLLAPDGNWTEWGDASHPGLTWQGQALHTWATTHP